MTRKYSLLIEGDESGYSAHVPELPAILVTGPTIDVVRSRAREAIQLWWEATYFITDKYSAHGPTSCL